MSYGMRYPFIISALVDKYAGAFEDRWVNHVVTGVYLVPHWLKVSIRVVAQFQRGSYENCSDDEDIVSFEWKKELFVNSSYPALIKSFEEKYDALDRIYKGGVIYPRLIFMICSILVTSSSLWSSNSSRTSLGMV